VQGLPERDDHPEPARAGSSARDRCAAAAATGSFAAFEPGSAANVCTANIYTAVGYGGRL